jgi:nifR3 family TIM-barrel protein
MISSEPIINASHSPMAGITDSPFRRISRRFGSVFSYTEFVSTEDILNKKLNAIHEFKFQESERPIIFQIFGNDTNSIRNATSKISELNPDFIDLNMGCSTRKVTHRGAGASLLLNLTKASQMIDSMVKVTNIPITAKIRIGWDDTKINFKETIRALEESGITRISVHGRTKEMAYTGEACWESIKEAKEISKVPIFGNGDIKSLEDIHKRFSESNVDLVLVGRGSIGNPWIFSGINKKNLRYSQIKPIIEEHLEYMVEFYGEELGCISFRKHLLRYLDSIDLDKDLRIKLLSEKTIVNLKKLLREIPHD